MSSYLDKTGLERFWAAIKNKFAPKDRGIQYIRGTWTAASGTWTGVSKDSELYDGKQIILYMPFAGSGNATLNLTLAGGGTTGAKNVYFEGSTRFTTHKGQNSQLHLIYHSAQTLSNGTTYEGWWYVANRDTDTNNNYQLRNYNKTIKLAEAIPKYHLAAYTSTGYKKVVSGLTFDITYPLVCASSAWEATTQPTDAMFIYQGQNIRSILSGLGSSYAGLTAGKVVYLVGTLSGTNFTVDSSLVTCTQPTAANGKAYIPFGEAYSTYQLHVYPQRTVYEYSNGSFHQVGNNQTEDAVIQVPLANWSSSTSTVNGGTYYTCAVTLLKSAGTGDYKPRISIEPTPGNTLPTEAEQNAYDLLKYATVDNKTLTLYATVKPISSFYITLSEVSKVS